MIKLRPDAKYEDCLEFLKFCDKLLSKTAERTDCGDFILEHKKAEITYQLAQLIFLPSTEIYFREMTEESYRTSTAGKWIKIIEEAQIALKEHTKCGKYTWLYKEIISYLFWIIGIIFPTILSLASVVLFKKLI